MFRFVLRHFNLYVLTLLVLCIFSFWLAYLFPGDPLVNLTGLTLNDPADYQAMAQKYHMDSGILVQFWHYLVLLWDGDWGFSFSSGLPLYQEIFDSLPATVELSTYALLLSLLIGIPLGFLAGLRHHRTTDNALLAASVVGYSTPVFWLALLMILLFSLQLGWFPLSGRISLLFDVPHDTGFILVDIWLSDMPNKGAAMINAVQHMVMPVLSITIVTTAIVLRLTRRAVVEVMPKEYVQAAYARGLSKHQVILRHVVRNAMLPILPLLAMQSTILLTNAMIVEVIYSWPGIGNWLIQAIYQRDYPAIRAGMLAVSTLVVSLTIFIDLLARIIDPTRERGARAKI
ncbi:ABC transporter permease [Aestuariibacter halophilus]|uniref:ABC transporter permease n=1 Tax=Fluctibacter halophilus TaxID=226011 RepID=A0ABS8G7Z8_9ALTE|nr:ABC transporter permease [Aestuariibacter halophilus]MCC2616658.1 ABC transporter permease [Aestuariibacter halophilus]